MDTLQAIVLAFIQGLTEFLPVSSSAHLVFIPLLSGWDVQDLVFDVCVHLGTLCAVLIYFARDWIEIINGLWQRITNGSYYESYRTLTLIVIATVPACMLGAAVKLLDFDNFLRTLMVITIANIVFALFLYYADKTGEKKGQLDDMSFQDALVIGLAQALAVIPGTSRSGVTISAALMLGYTRETSAKFSFLLAVPIIIAATILSIGHAVSTDELPDINILGISFLVSFVTALLSIHFFMKLLSVVGMTPFVIYRIILGLVLLAFIIRI